MIDKDEIIQKSKEFEIHTSDVQRDYVFGWILAGIYTVSDLKDILILKGGNCLRKAYFENTRYSNDLDFTTQTPLTEDFLKTELNKVCDFAQEASGVIFVKDKNVVQDKKGVDREKKAYDVRLYFKDFYGTEGKFTIRVSLDITQYDRIYLPTQKRFIIHPYSDYQKCKTEIKCLKLEEVLASKLKCLLQRRHSADLYDYVFWIFFDTGIEIQRAEIVSTLLKVTIFERSPGFLKGLLLNLPFQIIKGLWQKYLVCPKGAIIDFEAAVGRFMEHIAELFANFPEGRGEHAFFPPEFRNIILDAGTNMTMIEIVYDGIQRMVEPYSLVYKQRKDGVAREYFYVYDTTGGRTSGPSIKSFVHTNIQEIRPTDKKFEPRYEVELSKAGESAKNSYFGKPFSKRQISVRKGRHVSIKSFSLGGYGPTYIYQCPMCQKRFSRNKMNSDLNIHKDKYGNQCFGKTGYLVDTRY
ncbi:MAG: nucleotidyl transferase AbiEii/AbiGii toxin family protein [Phycisphaerae bacterium]|jgi:predicted nucleotidyltransferase component of viral defense system